MKHIRIPFLVVALSLTLTGMAFAIDLPALTTWSVLGVLIHGTTVGGVGGGGTGRGDVLLGPLFDARDLTDPNLPGSAGATSHAQQTLIAIVNTDPLNGVVGRLRFKEWKRSWEVLDIDIPLTSNDVWVGQVSRLATGGGVLTSTDYWISNIVDRCTSAATFGQQVWVAANFPGAGFAFRTTKILDGDPNPIARTEYGEFEFIGEEIFTSPITASGTINRMSCNPDVAGIAPCLAGVFGASRDVGNTLEGTVFLVRPDIAISHQYNMTAIDNFVVDICGIYSDPTTDFPNLYHEIQGGPNPAAPLNPGAGGFDNLEALLAKKFIDFQYVDNNGNDPDDSSHTPMSTSVVVTFPTKYWHYRPPDATPWNFVAAYPNLAPFTGQRETLGDEARLPVIAANLMGEVVGCSIWDRMEHLLVAPNAPISPAPTAGLCRFPYQVNVIGLYPTDPGPAAPIFRNNLALPTASAAAAQTFYSGWGRFDLSPAQDGASDGRIGPQGKVVPTTFNFFNNFFNAYRGLPAIGVVMTEFYNGSVSGYYGNTVPWQYGVDWRITGTILPW